MPSLVTIGPKLVEKVQKFTISPPKPHIAHNCHINRCFVSCNIPIATIFSRLEIFGVHTRCVKISQWSEFKSFECISTPHSRNATKSMNKIIFQNLIFFSGMHFYTYKKSFHCFWDEKFWLLVASCAFKCNMCILGQLPDHIFRYRTSFTNRFGRNLFEGSRNVGARFGTNRSETHGEIAKKNLLTT